jgi:hypothetical protein
MGHDSDGGWWVLLFDRMLKRGGGQAIGVTTEDGIFTIPAAVFDNRTDRTSFLRADQSEWDPVLVERLHVALAESFTELNRSKGTSESTASVDGPWSMPPLSRTSTSPPPQAARETRTRLLSSLSSLGEVPKRSEGDKNQAPLLPQLAGEVPRRSHAEGTSDWELLAENRRMRTDQPPCSLAERNTTQRCEISEWRASHL